MLRRTARLLAGWLTPHRIASPRPSLRPSPGDSALFGTLDVEDHWGKGMRKDRMYSLPVGLFAGTLVGCFVTPASDDGDGSGRYSSVPVASTDDL